MRVMSEVLVCPCCGVTLRVDAEGKPWVIGVGDELAGGIAPDEIASESYLEAAAGPGPVGSLESDSRVEIPAFSLDSSTASSVETAVIQVSGLPQPGITPVSLPEGASERSAEAVSDELASTELTIAALGLDRPDRDVAFEKEQFNLGTRSAEQDVGSQSPRDVHASGSIGRSAAREDLSTLRGLRSLDRARPTTWGTVLLAGYAGALTLLLTWLYFSGRIARPRRSHAPTPASSSSQLEEHDPSPPPSLPEIPAAQRLSLGESIRLGEIEVTPVDVVSRPVSLRNVVDPEQWRDEPDDALWLRLRIRNLSTHTKLAPIDPTFVRQPDRGIPQSLIDTGGQPIYPYPLALASEWEIVGQEFRELEPGEEREILIVSESGIRGRLRTRMTWHVRLRTGINQTDVLGVDFGLHELD
jgi:hypothetical protein